MNSTRQVGHLASRVPLESEWRFFSRVVNGCDQHSSLIMESIGRSWFVRIFDSPHFSWSGFVAPWVPQPSEVDLTSIDDASPGFAESFVLIGFNQDNGYKNVSSESFVSPTGNRSQLRECYHRMLEACPTMGKAAATTFVPFSGLDCLRPDMSLVFEVQIQ